MVESQQAVQRRARPTTSDEVCPNMFLHSATGDSEKGATLVTGHDGGNGWDADCNPSPNGGEKVLLPLAPV